MSKDRTGEKTGSNIAWVAKDGLCTGCGTCTALCPRGAIRMVIDEKQGIYLPVIDAALCNDCGICLKVCPGHEVDFVKLNEFAFGTQPADPLLGHYIACYTGHATDQEIRYNCSSGGLVTALLIHMLESGEIDGALVTRMRKDRPLEPEPFIARTREEIYEARGSKYCPVPANVALKEILEKPGRYAVVGLPCHMHGLRKAEMINSTLRERVVMRLGLVCSHEFNFVGTKATLKKQGIKTDDVNEIKYRGEGWPGSMKVGLQNGETALIPYDHYILPHQLYFYSIKRCLLCVDFIGRFSDATLMDAWLPDIIGNDNNGTSLLIVRTNKCHAWLVQAVRQNGMKLFQIRATQVLHSQGGARLKNSYFRAHSRIMKFFNSRVPAYGVIAPQSRLIHYLRVVVMGMNYFISRNNYIRWLIGPAIALERRFFNAAKASLKSI